MTTPAAVTLLWGEDPYLLRETALELVGDRRSTEVDANEWRGSELQDLATPSLFGEPRALVVTDVRALPKEAMRELGGYPGPPGPGVAPVPCCTGAERGKPPGPPPKPTQPTRR